MFVVSLASRAEASVGTKGDPVKTPRLLRIAHFVNLSFYQPAHFFLCWVLGSLVH